MVKNKFKFKCTCCGKEGNIFHTNNRWLSYRDSLCIACIKWAIYYRLGLYLKFGKHGCEHDE